MLERNVLRKACLTAPPLGGHGGGMSWCVALMLTALAAPEGGSPVLVVPAQARSGASKNLGSTLSQLVVTAIQERGVKAASFDSVAAGNVEPVVFTLARCTEPTCAAELGRTLRFPEVVVGVVDGGKSPPLLTFWRVRTSDQRVLGTYQGRADDKHLATLSQDPSPMLRSLFPEWRRR